MRPLPGHIVGILLFVLCAAARAEDACTFEAPQAVLRKGAYVVQSFVRLPGNRATERAQLGRGIVLEIRQSQCVDVISTEFVLTAPPGEASRARAAGDGGWIGLARELLANLKTRDDRAKFEELDHFLETAPNLPEHAGIRSICRDGTVAGAGECSWESTGGFSVTVSRSARATRIAVLQYLSG